jgi:hypothetical protein
MPSQPSNSQSTAWAVQGLVAAGRNPARFKRGGRSPLQFIASLQQGNGSFRYSKRSAQTPVWVTAQALTALQRKAFPLKAAALRRKSSSSGAGASSSGGSASDPASGGGGKKKRKKAGEEDAAGDSTAADDSAAAGATPGTPGVSGKQTSETLGSDDSGTGDLTRTIAIVVGAAVILMGVGWWRMRRGGDPLGGA